MFQIKLLITCQIFFEDIPVAFFLHVAKTGQSVLSIRDLRKVLADYLHSECNQAIY